MSDPKAARKTLFAGIALLTCALVVARLFEAATESLTPPRAFEDATVGLGRLREILSAAPGIASDRKPDAVVLGASRVVFGFSPEAFDARLRQNKIDLTSYNWGLLNADPSLLRLFAKRIRSIWEKHAARLSVSILEFDASNATTASKPKRCDLLNAALLMDWRDWAKISFWSPGTGAELAAIEALGGVGSPEITELLKPRIFRDQGDPETALLDKIYQKLDSIYGRPFPAWDARRRGESRCLFPETREEYAALCRMGTSPDRLAKWRHGAAGMHDLFELRFSESKIAEFIQAAKDLEAVSDHTYLLLAPRNHAWAGPTPEGAERLRRVLARIERETGAKWIDLFDAGAFQSSDFRDPIHLNESGGRPKFSRVVADKVARFMKADGGDGLDE